MQTQLNMARAKLQQAWEARGETDVTVLEAGNEFDVLLNEYQRRLRKVGKKKRKSGNFARLYFFDSVLKTVDLECHYPSPIRGLNPTAEIKLATQLKPAGMEMGLQSLLIWV